MKSPSSMEEANSEGENSNQPKGGSKNVMMSNSNDGSSKPKRQMKTPYQLETLERAYAMDTYPSESVRMELSEKLGLSDRQLQMWFCHRRLKDKKESSAPKKLRMAPPSPGSPMEEVRAVRSEPGSEYGSGSGSGSGSSPIDDEPREMDLEDMPLTRRYSEASPRSVMELRAIACVEAQLGESLREDGPILGMEFDPLPIDAFEAPIEQQRQSGYAYDGKVYERRDAKSDKDRSNGRADAYGQIAQSPYHDSPVDIMRGRASAFVHGGEQLPRVHGGEQLPRVHGGQGQVSHVRLPSKKGKKGHVLSSHHRDEEILLQQNSLTNRLSAQPIGYLVLGTEDADVFSDAQISHHDTELQMERKRKGDEARVVREVEGHEICIRKELGKQDMLRRKNEERMKKEMERYDRERRKEEEKLMRERQREEERSLREQKRELERREKLLQRENLKAEKMRQKEELRIEREAVKRKAAVEKAAARKIAKESLDLIEDEQLELMELAATSKGLSSIVHLNYDTLQNLESFRVDLCTFPPDSVHLKKPFAVQPWMDSEENIGNLLMVWRFFITFADVLRLWPFTLNEFVQAFHDYDSRLLGEIHVALLKLIIKDIEDVARTPSTGLGTNQYCTANPEGGHPQIVQGAYTWGFDIRNWQQHLNPLTWPEIFRQLALSAGFGPQLKKKRATRGLLGDNDEVKGCEDIISTLRSGSAAESAFALMREKGLLLPRKSRHRLTPGTVKFAAFHVLSLEGDKGLTVLELADKIQKSGLRDLTTSKTPEASISVALTRDQKLFERIAPSTYCVRAAFRKDPADAEAILSAARKKIRIFENGFLGGEEADDVERDEESEVDVDEDPEVEDLATPLSANRSVDHSKEGRLRSASGKDTACSSVSLTVHNESEKELPSIVLSGNAMIPTTQCAPQVVIGASNVEEKVEIDESKSGESWIQGLTEGEYSHLSVEERLNALVALVAIVNEGNSVRAILEDRLEAANALKKHMWAEAQLDRSRLKEDIIGKLDFSSFTGSRAETQLANSLVEGSQSPLAIVDGKNKEKSPSTAEDQKPLAAADIVQNHHDSIMNTEGFSNQQHGYASKRSRSQLKAYIGHMAEEMYVYRSLPLGQDRRRNRYWQFVTSASKNDPCSGRVFVELNNGNWRVIDTEEAFDGLVSSLDNRGVRESHLRIMMQKIETSFKENARKSSENMWCQSETTNESEAAETDSSPHCSLDPESPSSVVYCSNSYAMDTSLFRIELGRNATEKKSALRRYQDFQKWMWKECFNSFTFCAMKYGKNRCAPLLATCDYCFDSHLSEDTHCLSCHQTFNAANKSFDYPGHVIQCKEERKSVRGDTSYSASSLPLGIRLLKALLAFLEASVLPEAIESFWTENHRKTWAMNLHRSASTEEILQVLTMFESVMKRDYVSSNFEMTKELLGYFPSPVPAVGPIPVLPWLPKTTAALALRIFELDSSVIYMEHEKAETSVDKSAKVYMKLPPRYSPYKNEDVEQKELKQGRHIKEDNYGEMRSKRKNNKRRRGGRDKGPSTKLQRRVPGIKSDTGRRGTRGVENLNQGLRQHGRKTDVQGTARGRRTVRKRRADTVPEEPLLGRLTARVGSMSYLSKKTVDPKSYGGSFSNLEEEEEEEEEEEDWGVEKEAEMDVEGANSSNSAGAAESDDNVEEEGYEQGNWEQGFTGVSNGWNGNPMEVSDADGDGSEDDNGIEVMGNENENEDSDGDTEMSDGSPGQLPHRTGNDEGSDSAVSDDYSD